MASLRSRTKIAGSGAIGQRQGSAEIRTKMSRDPQHCNKLKIWKYLMCRPCNQHIRTHKNSVLRIRDVYPGSRIRIKEFKYFNPQKKTKKNGFSALENMIRVVHPGSRIRMLTFYPSRIPDPRVKKAPDPGSATLQKLLSDLCPEG